MSSNKLKSGVARVDARLLLIALNHIATHGGVAIPELMDVTGLSKASTSRLILNAREQYGVDVSWRRDNTMPSHGEYTIDDWGVFSREKVKKFLSKND